MANFRTGTVRVENANATVRHIWRVNYTASSGTFLVGQLAKWGDTVTYKTITGATQADPVVITEASHGFTDGQSVTIADVVGMTDINALSFTVFSATTNTFALFSTDGTGFSAYVSGGTATLTDSSTGYGTVTGNDTTGNVLQFYRTSGTLPAAGQTISNASGTSASATMYSLFTGSPPLYDISLTVGDKFLVSGSTLVSTVSSTIASDTFDLSAVYAGITQNGVGYNVLIDATSFYQFPKPSPDVGLDSEIVAVALDEIDSRIKEIGNVEQSIGSTSGSISVDWTLGHGALFTLTEAVTSIAFTNPRGPSLLYIQLKQDGTGGRTVTGWPAAVNFTDEPIVDLRADKSTVIPCISVRLG